MLAHECNSCVLNREIASLPPWERTYLTDDWRLAHTASALPGYMVLSPRRHVVALDELTTDEMVQLGPLLAATTAALRTVVGCLKTYVMLFAERPGWAHVHFHVVPRMASFTDQHIGPGAIEFVNRPESEWVAPAERTRLSAEIGELVAAHFANPS